MNSTPHVDFSGAQWWWPEGLEPRPDQFADFAADIELPETPGHAWIAATTGSWFTLWVNGEWVWHGPPREVAPWQYNDVIDICRWLRPGVNRIRIRAYHLGVTCQFHEACLAGLMLRGVVAGPGWNIDLGDRQIWRAAVSPAFLGDSPRLHNCIGFGEHVDLSTEQSAWLDNATDPRWLPPAVVAEHPLAGREKLLPSDLPVFVEKTWPAAPRSVSEGWQVWDFGGEVFGFVLLDVEAADSCTCTLLHGESLASDGLPDYAFGGGDFREVLELPKGRRRWESFEKRAMRYIALPSAVQVHSLSLREYQRPLIEVWRGRPSLKNADPRDVAIIAAAARTVRLCCDDLLNDCPRRERSQYNDPSLYMDAFPILFGTWEPIRRWLRQYSRGADSTGLLRMCYPSPPAKGIIPDFSISFASNLHAYLDATADIETVRECFTPAIAGVATFEKHADSHGLLSDVPGWVFLCNSFELAKHPRSAALNALWADAWNHLAALAEQLGDARAAEFRFRAKQVREAWRSCFLNDGRILDADSSPDHERRRWWNFHYEADRGYFSDTRPEPGAFVLAMEWEGEARRLAVAAPGSVRLWCNGTLILDKTPRNPWAEPHPFSPWECELPPDFRGGQLLVEVKYNRIDWDVYLAANSGSPARAQVGEVPAFAESSLETLLRAANRPVHLRRWCAPRFNQITAGYAIASGMLDAEEALPILRSCVRDDYHVPWMKRTTPLICTPTDDEQLILDRAVLCNTPQSLAFFCRALRAHGMNEEARDICRRIFGAIIDAGSSTLWEEFAPRSSLCHAWGAMCVPFLI